jgi:exodeoxyribonuclease VII large subunit
MPELIENRQVFTLTEVANSIRKTIADRYLSGYWIKAEINKLNRYAKSGHCFPELVYKKDGVIECEMRATIWRTDFEKINAIFKKQVNESLKDGIQVLLFANITYEPKYGLSLVIRDIDPSFSLGELEREKRETIDKLQKENLFGKNKLVDLALLPKRIAVISVETSKGYQDFIKVIDQNIFGYRFFHFLFPAVLQGDASIKTIKSQLNRIKKVKRHFDAVAIIRGGGADVGLSSFNDYSLSKAICNFPLPVFTGIGHSTNLTVSEMVAYQSAITPTELADFFIQKFHDFAVPVQRAQEVLPGKVNQFLEMEKRQFNHTIKMFQSLTTNQLSEIKFELNSLSKNLLHETKMRMNNERENLAQFRHSLLRSGRELFKEETALLDRLKNQIGKDVSRVFRQQHDQLKSTEKIIELVDPMNVVKRGYTLTTVNGKLVRSISEIKEGQTLETQTSDGVIHSTVTKKNKNHE